MKSYMNVLVSCCIPMLLSCSSREGGNLKSFPQDEATLIKSIIEEEDSRPGPDVSVPAIMNGLQSSDSNIRRIAVRALGRLERIDLVDEIQAFLRHDVTPNVRAEAADALAQSVFRVESLRVQELLIDSFDAEKDQVVRGAIARSLGRLVYSSEAARNAAERVIANLIEEGSVGSLVGAVRGLESLVRKNRDHKLSDETFRMLKSLVNPGRSDKTTRGGDHGLIRSIAMKVLGASGRVDGQTIQTALTDLDLEVRRSAVAAVSGLEDNRLKHRIIQAGLKDTSAAVRFEALRIFGGQLMELHGCDPVHHALGDKNPHVSLQAIDLLGRGCGPAATHLDPVQLLREYCDNLGDDDDLNWQKPAHAIVSLARLAPEAAREYLNHYAQHGRWQVRMYAARAASIAGSSESLMGLTSDPHPNVIRSALVGLNTISGHQADRQYLHALSQSDYHLVSTAARNLRGTSNRAAVPSLIKAFGRISLENRDTSRDPRRAILDALAGLGGPTEVRALEPYLEDYDPVVAGRVAQLITGWSKEARTAAPKPLRRVGVPEVSTLNTLSASMALVTMAGLGEFEIKLLPLESPTVTAKFARLTAEGYFNGLTFHRVAPNFVIQGGSPGANEFTGASRYTRDEITARPHLRGTVGISTRGRDTGDAQIFVNLVDNLRLDHNYTIIGEVVQGMEVVDRVLEGSVIEGIRIVP